MTTLDDMLKELQEREVDRLDGTKAKLTEEIYPNLPAVIKSTAAITETPEEVLVRACVQSSFHYESIDWRLMLDLVRSFFLAKKRIESKEKE